MIDRWLATRSVGQLQAILLMLVLLIVLCVVAMGWLIADLFV